jgi:hypothetical protein
MGAPREGCAPSGRAVRPGELGHETLPDSRPAAEAAPDRAFRGEHACGKKRLKVVNSVGPARDKPERRRQRLTQLYEEPPGGLSSGKFTT